MRLSNRLTILSVVAVLFFSSMGVSYASVSVSGIFHATNACPAYQSKNKKTNPGNVALQVGADYSIQEQNTATGATWFRVEIANANPTLRWVSLDCGEVTIGDSGSSSGGDSSGGTSSCSTAGQGDSYVFAVSWQPAFCETHASKPECKVTDTSAYQAGHFTLHGLWPNKQSCGTNYGFCGKYSDSVSSFCSYDAVPMTAATLEKLGQFMPSAEYGSCLQRHEWYKHGTCQTERNADGYYNRAIRLLEDFNNSGVATFMQDHMGETVSTSDFFDAVDEAFFSDAHERLQISCTNNKLVDVYINLPKSLDDNASLYTLMTEAEPKFSNKCGSTFVVDPIGLSN